MLKVISLQWYTGILKCIRQSHKYSFAYVKTPTNKQVNKEAVVKKSKPKNQTLR